MAAIRLGRKWRMGCRRWLVAGSLKTPIGVLTSLRRSGAATLLATVAFSGMLLAGAGCNTWGAGNYPAQIRPAASETSRLLSNAHYYKLMGRPDAALKEMEEAHQADPNNLKIADALAQNYQELGQFQRAQEIYQEVLASHGSNQALQNNLCFSFYLQGNLTKAESCFKEALERDPDNLAARNNLGLLWCRQGKLAEAQRLWEEAEGVAAGQARMKQALAFLGTKAPANYAKLPEGQPQTQAAAQSKSAPPATAASTAKPELAAAPTPVKSPILTRPAAVAPKVQQQVAVKPAEPKPVLRSQVAAPVKPAPSVAVAPPAKTALAAAPAPVKAPTPTPAAAPKVEQQVAAKPTEFKPAPQSQAAAAVKPTPPVTLASPAKSELAAAPASVKELTLTPPPAIAPKVEPKVQQVVAAKPVQLKPIPQSQVAVPVKPAPSAAVAPPAKTALAAAPAPVKAPTPTPAAAPKVEQKVAVKQAPPPQASAPTQPTAPKILASTAKTMTVKSPTTRKVSSPAPSIKPARPELKVADRPAPPSPPLTALERERAHIEVLNGNGTRNLAHQSSTLLYQEYFSVTEIGNHIDFGAKSTVIYCRPGAERVAQGLKWQVFPKAKIEACSALKDGVAIKILLGRDLLDQPLVMARLAAAASDAFASAKSDPVRPQVQAKLAAPAAPKVDAGTPAKTATFMGDLTSGDLLNTTIEIRNATRVRDLAQNTKKLLSSEGFTVGSIGDHFGFKNSYTVIYYRPEAEKVARVLNSEIFPEARLTPSSKLNRGTAIKLVLGHDSQRPRQLSRLATEKQ